MTSASSMRQRLLPIVLSLLAATVVACTEQTGPTAADLALEERDGRGKSDSGQQEGEYAIRGRVLQYSGQGSDSLPGDTLGRSVPVVGALVEAYFLSDIPADTGDTIQPPPPDTGDTIRPPVDSSRVTSLLHAGSPLSARQSAAPDSAQGRPPQRVAAAQDRTNGEGDYVLRNLRPGVYSVEVTRPGGTMVTVWRIVEVRDGDVQLPPFDLPPWR